uniref:Protein HGH1 homolog n=1 Tax=Callorhinchus milii TaxID=7868 RepID=A0A4W3H7T1_CALMI|eukprot:gi/632966445/ref/XP_007899419.1/ PREDICTED: protein FAM203A [Callorhinchus milii]
MLAEDQARELLSFLSLDTRADVKGQATGYLLGLTGSKDGCEYLGQRVDFLRALLRLTEDRSPAVVKDCYFVLVNLSAEESAHDALVKGAGLLPVLLKNLLDPGYQFSDQICSILSNLSRREATCPAVLRAIQTEEIGLARIVEIFCTEGYNRKASLHYLGPLLSNLTQLPEARHFVLDKDRCVVQRLLPYTQFQDSTVRRGGVVGTLRNCCFDYSYHSWLLSDQVDLLPFLLLPLAGPEELSEDEMEGLPVDLQYLPEDKQREKDPDIRKMLIEAINLLTATKSGREQVRERNAYVVVRELHKWEPEPDVQAACEKLVQVLISDEPEEGMENLLEVEVPEEIDEKLRQQDEEEQRLIEKEREELLKKEEEKENGERAREERPAGLGR